MTTFIKTIAHKIAAPAVAAGAVTLCAACHTIDDNRIPVTPVQITFATEAQWNVYGVAAALDSRSFIREKKLPANYPYTAATYTGYGGVLLVCDVLGQPRAYDLACPVECNKDIRVEIDHDDLLARCPVCKSAYNVFSLTGTPVEGPAAQNAYGLRNYRVLKLNDPTAYMLVTY